MYGVGTVVPRLLNYLLLTPFFTRVFEVGEYGVVTELYAYVVFMIIIMTYGMETGFFRFAQVKPDAQKVFSTSFISLLFTSGIFMAIIWLASRQIANILDYQDHPEYIIWIGTIVGIDAITAIPFARLRWENKPMQFAAIKIAGVMMNIVLNFMFLYFLPKTESIPEWVERIYRPETGVGYVFISNLVASIFTLLLLIPTLVKIKIYFSRSLLREMLVYTLPLLVSGLAGTVNEAIDRVLLKHLITDKTTALEQLGIYGANYKIAVLMTLFIQMFRYASEPFYFGQAKRKDSGILFAAVMKYFVISALAIFLMVNFYMDLFKHFIGRDFHEGLHIVPVILFANILLGIFFNLSIWYKLNDLTKYGAIITVTGAGITFMVNWFLIPVYGYLASAWAHVICYGSMVVLSWALGRRFYKIPYQLTRILMYVFLALALYAVSELISSGNTFTDMAKNTGLLAVFIIIVFFKEKKLFNSI